MIENWQKVAAREIEIPLSDVAAEQRVSGAPKTGSVQIEKFGGTVVGVWEMTPGVMRDVEVDEILTVLAGAATVEFQDGRKISLEPGAVARLHAGEQTVWTVTETLRKVYVLLPG
ncbi:cupin domain-containing protein [Dongia sp. agr-C8]